MGSPTAERRAGPIDRRSRVRIAQILAALPAVGLVTSAIAFVAFCDSLLTEAAHGDLALPSLSYVVVAVAAGAVSTIAIVFVQAVRARRHAFMPSRRLERALRRLRSGDLAFRVQLRRGDALAGLAKEVNLVLDWLNSHPPRCDELRLGGDVVHVDDEKAEVVSEVDADPHATEAVGELASGAARA
jgi:NADPH:quinone reductase-like Zn-dependent oxidoreductase